MGGTGAVSYEYERVGVVAAEWGGGVTFVNGRTLMQASCDVEISGEWDVYHSAGSRKESDYVFLHCYDVCGVGLVVESAIYLQSWGCRMISRCGWQEKGSSASYDGFIRIPIGGMENEGERCPCEGNSGSATCVLDRISVVKEGGEVARIITPTHIPLATNFGVLRIGIKSQGYREPDIVMSDSEDSTVTYMAVSSPFREMDDERRGGAHPMTRQMMKVDGDDQEDEVEAPTPGRLVISPPVHRVTLGYLSELRHPYHFLQIQSPTYPLGYKAAMIRLRAETPSTFYPLPLSTSPSGTPPLLPIPLPTSSPHLVLPSNDCRAGVSESSSAPTARPIGGFRADYGFVGTLDDEIRRYLERYVVNEERWLNMLFKDRRAHDRIALLIEREDIISREAWGRSMDANDTARSEVRALRTTVLTQQREIAALRATDRA
ncbi:hypothetical protein Tco_0923813 [Tanacetum coccineum]|uniref:Uncharacterized protein n=1 Tax=Tanacetum coccineum TaxID=301880 RepID=A0ABQ5D333_9ASTR